MNEIKYTYYGIRGTDNKEEIGNILTTSYVWDYENDRCTYGEENEEELGGVCTTLVSSYIAEGHAVEESAKSMFDTVDEFNAAIAEATEYAKKFQRGYKHYYLVASEDRNPYNMQEADDNEAILANAIVLMEV